MCLPFTPGSPNGPAYRITPPAGVGHAVETVYAAGADCDGVAAIGTVGFMFEEGPNCVAFPPNTPATWTAPPGTSLGQFSLLEAGHVHIDCNDGDMVLHATLCSDADCHSCVPVAATDGSQLDFDVVGECVTGGYVDFRWIAAVCPSSSGGEYFEPVAGEGCNSFVQMDMYDRYGVTGGQTTLQQCADAVRRLDGQEGCRADYFFFEDGGYCNCPTDSCENGGDNSAAGGPGQLYRFAHVAAPTAPGATPAPTGTPDPPGPGAQCFAGLTDMGSASALITPLGSTPECSSLVATIFGRIFPLLATPEAIPAAVAGLLDTSSQQFCECFAAIDDSLVVALLPVDGCVLGEYTIGDVLTLCANINVDITENFCDRGCHGRPVGDQIGVPSNGICCECTSASSGTGTPADSGSASCDASAACAPGNWPGYDGVTCGDCAALVNVRENGGTCEAFCARQGLGCVASWDDWADEQCSLFVPRQGCNTVYNDTSDAICECTTQALPGTETRPPTSTPRPVSEYTLMGGTVGVYSDSACTTLVDGADPTSFGPGGLCSQSISMGTTPIWPDYDVTAGIQCTPTGLLALG